MTKIQIEKMALRNFKGVPSADYAFGQITDITGGNGSGKSTIYEAYLWCLFDKNASGNKPKVQPLDEDNQVIHNLTTSVELALLVDGNPMKVERRMTEKKDGGTESKYLVNDVPMTQTQSNAKLSELLDIDKWFMISNINIIPNMDQKACRAALQSIAPTFDEKALAAKYNHVLVAINGGLTVDELAMRVKTEKTKAKLELDSIPARLDEIDKLRVQDDFTEVGKRIDAINAEVRTLTAEIEQAQKVTVDPAEAEKAEERRNRMNALNEQISAIEKRIIKEHDDRLFAITGELDTISRDTLKANADINAWEKQLQIVNDRLEQLNKEIEAARARWIEVNAQTYTGTALDEVCPTCGQPLPPERIEEAAKKAESNWNAEKTRQLESINMRGKALKAEVIDLNARVEDIQGNIEKTNHNLEEYKSRMDELNEKKDNIPGVADMLAENAEHDDLQKQYKALVDELQAETEITKKTEASIAEKVQPLKEKMEALMNERMELDKRIAAKTTNDRIDKQQDELLYNQKTLQQTIAEYEEIEDQVAAFKKEKITTVENGVSSLFSMVHWKMYEQNVTNSGEKEICQAIIDGVPYEQQNTATQVNAGIDIVEAFGKAYGVEAPLFIDNAESVSELLPIHRQMIKLTVVPGAELNINF